MGVATFEGFVEDGQIKLISSVRLPEGVKVYVVIPDVEEPAAAAYVGSPRLAHREQAVDFEKKIVRP